MGKRKRSYDSEPELKRIPVESYEDFWLGKYALIRLLYRIDGSIFPEYAIYGAKKAGLKEPFIFRHKDFNLFVYP